MRVHGMERLGRSFRAHKVVLCRGFTALSATRTYTQPTETSRRSRGGLRAASHVLGRTRDGSRSNQRLTQAGEHYEVSVKLNPRESANAKRGESVAVLQVSEGTLNGGAARVQIEYFRQLVVSPDDLGDSSSPNPRFFGLVGRAEGFALAEGSARPRPEHFLLALIWDADSTLNFLLRGRGVSPAEAQDALARQGVRVPPLTPPL